MERDIIMKEIELYHLANCPYCKKARKAIAELADENPAYAGLRIRWIEENERTDIADSRDYYYVPTIFFGGDKLYEANPTQSYEDIKRCIREAFDRILATP